jgi:hypothetical protein
MPQIIPIHPETRPIGTFLQDVKLRIPELQRPYSWETPQAIELVNDLRKVSARTASEVSEGGDEINEPQQQHFFGTIVLLNSLQDRMHIIDGQQRLTTTTLLLGLIEQAMIRVGKKSKKAKGPAAENVTLRAAQLAQSVHDVLWYSGALDDQGITPYFPRLEVSPEIRDRYLALLQGEKPRVPVGMPKGPERSLIEIAIWIQKNYVENKEFDGLEPVQQLRHLEECYKCITERLLVVSLTTQFADAGYDLFECLNARGLELEALDLVKVWMLAQMAGPREVSVAAAMRELSSGDRKQQSKYFADYFKLRVRKNPKQESAKAFAFDARREIFRDEVQTGIPHAVSIQDRIETEIHQMQKLSPLWHQLDIGKIPVEVHGSDLKRKWGESRLEIMTKDLLHKGLIFPLLTVAAEYSPQQLDDFVEFTHVVERFFFRYKVICGGHVGDLESAYFDLIKQFQHTKSLDNAYARTRLQGLLDDKANDAKFSLALQEKLSFAPQTASRRRIRYFLYTLDNYSFPAPPKLTIDDLDQYHIEHIAPQNPATTKLLSSEYVNDIGNLALLNPAINQQLSNLSFSEKKTKAMNLKLKNVNIDVVESQNVFYNTASDLWSSGEIEKRRGKLVQQALNVFKMA